MKLVVFDELCQLFSFWMNKALHIVGRQIIKYIYQVYIWTIFSSSLPFVTQIWLIAGSHCRGTHPPFPIRCVPSFLLQEQFGIFFLRRLSSNCWRTPIMEGRALTPVWLRMNMIRYIIRAVKPLNCSCPRDNGYFGRRLSWWVFSTLQAV